MGDTPRHPTAQNRISRDSSYSHYHVYFAFVVYEELYATRMFETMSIQTDEDEHSIEMHLPYIAKVMERYSDQGWLIG